MHSTAQDNIPGLLTNGELDSAWLMNNSEELLDKRVIKILIKHLGGKSLSVHGKVIRFSKRFGDRVPRVNLGATTFSGANYSVSESKKLIFLNEEELFGEKEKRARRKSRKLRFKDACEDFKLSEMFGLMPSTSHGYDTLLNRIVRIFSGTPVNKLTHRDVEKWLKESVENDLFAHKTLKDTLWMLKQVISRSRFLNPKSTVYEVIDFNILHRCLARYERPSKTIDETKTLSAEDISKLDALSHEDLERENLHVIRDSALLTAKSVAMRSGEARAVALEDISLGSDGTYKLNVIRSIVLEEFKEPKTYIKSLSCIDVFGIAHVYLERLMKNAQSRSKQRIEVRSRSNKIIKQEVTLLAANPLTNKPYTEREYRNELYRLQRFAGIANPIPPKQLRHTAARLFREAGISVKDYCKQFTHASTQTTIKFYTGNVFQGNTPEKRRLINEKLDCLWKVNDKLSTKDVISLSSVPCSVIVSKNRLGNKQYKTEQYGFPQAQHCNIQSHQTNLPNGP